MNILKLNKSYVLVLFLITIISSCCNRNEKYLKEAIRWDAIVCPLIHTEDSNTVLIAYTAHNLIKELQKYPDIDDAETYLYMSIRNNTPIHVSDVFYTEMLKFRIHTDSIMNDVYMEYGVSGLLKKYFKKEELLGGILILRNLEEGFLVKGKSPYPAFGLEHNVGYMAYLLAKHNIYLNYVWIDHILMVVINEEFSDMENLEINR